MTMTWTSLTASKGTSGSIANWVNYTKLDIGTVLDEAQALIYQYLRVREMRTRGFFTLTEGMCFAALPTNYLDPAGTMNAPSLNIRVRHKDLSDLKVRRLYDQETGTLTNPFTTTIGSSVVTVAKTGHDLTQGSIFYASGASAVGGITLNGTFEVVNIATNSFDIETGTVATSSAVGGGASVSYVAQRLIPSSPGHYSIWDERFQFDCAFNDTTVFDHFYYRSLPVLSASNQSNFLCTRYPNLLRTACQTSAADYMKDDGEYQKGLQRLQMLVQRIQAQDELLLHDAEILTETP